LRELCIVFASHGPRHGGRLTGLSLKKVGLKARLTRIDPRIKRHQHGCDANRKDGHSKKGGSALAQAPWPKPPGHARIRRRRAAARKVCFPRHAKAVSLDGESCVAFQAYAAQRGWRAQRFGHLLGSFEDEGVVRVEAIYEPPQDGHAQGVTLLDDALASGVDAVANALGLKRVGCIFSHPPREAGFVFSGAEVIRSAELQLDCANGVEETPFVSVRVTCDEAGAAVFEAYQVSLQAMAMVAEGALSGDAADGAGLKVHDTFTAVVAGKAEKKVDAQFFLCNVAVKQHASTLLRASFPKENRLVNRTRLDLKQQLQRARASGEPVVAGISDFGLLTFLLESPQVFDHASFLPALCETGV